MINDVLCPSQDSFSYIEAVNSEMVEELEHLEKITRRLWIQNESKIIKICLYKWLQSLPDKTHSFKKVHDSKSVPTHIIIDFLNIFIRNDIPLVIDNTRIVFNFKMFFNYMYF